MYIGLGISLTVGSYEDSGVIVMTMMQWGDTTFVTWGDGTQTAWSA